MKKQYDDDDGRTIADMSGIERRPLLLPKLHRRGASEDVRFPGADGTADGETELISDPGENIPKKVRQPQMDMNREERGAAMRGAVMAGLLIAGVLLVGLAIVILIFTKFGH